MRLMYLVQPGMVCVFILPKVYLYICGRPPHIRIRRFSGLELHYNNYFYFFILIILILTILTYTHVPSSNAYLTCRFDDILL